MRRITAAGLFLALALPVARADEKADEASKKLNGTYEVVAVLLDGKSDDKKKDEVQAFVIKDGEITVKTGKRDEKTKFTVDPSKKPAHFDISPKDEKEVVPGIYETKDTDKGLELTIAFGKDFPKADRPKDFKGDGTFVIKLLRKKDK